MSARGYEEGGGGFAVHEHWHDHGDIGQMGAAVIGRVERINIASVYGAFTPRQDCAHAFTH